MDLKLSYKFCILLKSFIWISYVFFLLNVLNSGNDSEVVYGVLLGAIIIQMTIVLFINNWYKNKKPMLLDWFRLTTFFVIVLNFFFLIKELKHQNNFSGYIIKSELIIPTLLVIIIGLLGLKISESVYVYFKLGKQQKKGKNYNFRNVYFFYLITIVLAFIQVFLMLMGEVGYAASEDTSLDYSFLFQIVFILCASILSIYAIFEYLFSYKKRFFSLFFLIFFVIQIIYGFLSGMKESIIVPLIIVLIPYLLSGRKLSKKYLIIGFLVLILIYPLNNNYRIVLLDFPNIERQDALSIAFVKTISFGFSENINQGSDDFSNRLSLFPYLVYSVDKEQEWNYYKNLNRYLYLPFAWIVPRIIIPDKPLAETGRVLNEKIYIDQATTSLTPTTYGWAYYEGGYIYVFILFLLFGLFITYFEYNLRNDNLFGLILYIGILILLLKVENDIYFLINGVLQSLLINFLVIKILMKQTVRKL
jgi:hypothetical protein